MSLEEAIDMDVEEELKKLRPAYRKRVSPDTRALLGVLRRAYPWARYVSRSGGGRAGTVSGPYGRGALRLHEMAPEVTEEGGFAPTGLSVELPPELLPEVPPGTAVRFETLMKEGKE